MRTERHDAAAPVGAPLVQLATCGSTSHRMRRFERSRVAPPAFERL